MENLLTSYLYNFKNCPLPTVGSLILQPGAAVSMQSDKLMHAPSPHIQFVPKEINADELLYYISQENNISLQQASDELSNYCNRLLEMQPYQELTMGSAGNFYVTEDGELHFKYNIIPAAFLPTVLAERVVHPEASHKMLVGDTQTNTAAMAELLVNNEKVNRPKWIWAAIALGAAGLLLIAVHLMKRQPADKWGNNTAVKGVQAPAATYQPSSK